MNDSHASLLPLSGSRPGGPFRVEDLLVLSVFLRLTGLPLHLASSSASASDFACASVCAVCSVTSVMNIASISSMLISMTSGLDPLTISTLLDDLYRGDTGDVGMYAVSGFSLLFILTLCSSITSGFAARSSLSIASCRALALYVNYSTH